jgi:hypothetical protein
MADITGIALAQYPDHSHELMATTAREGSRDTVWHLQQTDPDSNDWTAWQPFGQLDSGTYAPAIRQRPPDGSLEVVIMSRDGSIWHRWQTDSGNWSDWSPLGTPGGDGLLLPLALAQNRDGRLEVFVVRQDGSARHRWELKKGNHTNWSGWSQFGLPNGELLGPLAIGNDIEMNLVAFAPAKAAHGGPAVWHRRQLPTVGGGWSSWSSLGTLPGGRDPGEVVVEGNVDGRLEIFTIASDGAVWHRWQQRRPAEPDSWEPAWHSLGHQADGFAEVAVRIDAGGHLALAATSGNGRDLWLRTQTTPNDGWDPSWLPLPSVPIGPVQRPLLYMNKNGGLGLLLRTPSTGGLFQLIQPELAGTWTPGHQWSAP